MRYRHVMFVSAWLVSAWLAAAAATAQAVEPAPGSRANWTLQPAATSAMEFRRGSPIVLEPSGRSPFRFSDGNDGGVSNQPPPRAMDREAVLGTERAWLGGRPPLDCAMTPLDARCH
jgi:hypothetical protein